MRPFGSMALFIAIVVTGCGIVNEPDPRTTAQNPTEISPGELVDRYQRAGAAYEAGEIARFCELTEALVDAWPDHPRLIYNLARCHALEGRSDAALEFLDRLVSMRIAIDFREDEDLRSLHELPRFTALVDRYAAAIEPTTVGQVAFRLSDPEFVPEDVAWDPVSGDLFLSSIRQRKIIRIDGQGNRTLFTGYPDIEMPAALSMAVDSGRRRLWLTTAAAPSMVDYRPRSTKVGQSCWRSISTAESSWCGSLPPPKAKSTSSTIFLSKLTEQSW